jgi:hypothetical protein
MAENRAGGCLCGAVRYELKGDPIRTMICNCKNCQRSSGSALSTIALVSRDALSVSGDLKGYEYAGDSGNMLEIKFCSNCGSPVLLNIPAMPDIVSIKVGSFDNTDWYEPQVNIWKDSGQNWLPEITNCVSFPRNAG